MRIRTIKPEFWTDATMVQMEPLARLLFIGLWNVADDHGYLPDEPDRLAMLVLPKEAPERVAEMLDLLEAADRIERIEDEEGAVLRIKNWERHQRVDKPSVSRLYRTGHKAKIPDAVRRAVATKYGCKPGREAEAKCFHCGATGTIHWWKLASGAPSAWVTFAGLQLDHLEAEANGGATTETNIVLACRACNAGKKNNHAFSLMLANFREGSGNPRESSGTERKGKEEEGKGREQEREVEGNATSLLPAAEDLRLAWNSEADPKLPRCLRLTDGRKAHAKARLAEHGLPKMRQVIAGINASEFCLGKNNRGWVADFDFLVKPDTPPRVLEGKYNNRTPSDAPKPRDTPTQYAEGMVSF